jgi:hypothetical protein
MFFNTEISDRKILRYLKHSKCFKDSRTIYNALKTETSSYTLFRERLILLSAQHKILMVPLKDTYIFSKPLKLANKRYLSGFIDTYTYLLLSSEANL